MSSKEQDYEKGSHQTKRGRERACDVCRRRKCDGSQSAGDKCMACFNANLECTYLETPAHSEAFGAADTHRSSYVDYLEARLEQLEALVHQLRIELANAHFTNTSNFSSAQFSGSSAVDANINLDREVATNPGTALLQLMRLALSSLGAPQPPPHPDELMHFEILRKLDHFSIGIGKERGFIGKGCGISLVNAAIDLKADANREQSLHDQVGVDGGVRAWSSRRSEYWAWKPCARNARRPQTYNFPSEPLMGQLLELYFIHQNIYLPLLHRPTFERGVADGLHLRDDGFAATVLLSTDPSLSGTGLACGWEWFNQLAVEFLTGSSALHVAWTLVGVGLRLAQALGVHRRTAHIEVPSAERELLKRAFWVLVWLDRSASSALGRPCALQYDDFDVELPLECDDEFWEHPIHPSNNQRRTSRITTFYLQSEDTVWAPQVRWDPARADPVFFDQSVALHCKYYHLQIFIHRPFIPMVRKSASTALPSLAICTSAARACANMVDVQRRRKGDVPVVINLLPVFTSGIVLLLNVWSGKRTGMVPDTNREMENVFKCMQVVRTCETHWQSAGAFWDILAELASVGQLPLPMNGMPASSQPVTPDGFYPRSDDTPLSVQDTSRDIDQTFDFPIHHTQLRASYAHMQQPSWSFPSGVAGSGTASAEPSMFVPMASPGTWFPHDDPYAEMSTDPAQASRELGEIMNLIDSDTISMWTNAPVGLEVDDWGTYLSNFGEITQQATHADAGIDEDNRLPT
ncbi:hypothetical protein B0H13DRAFT_1861756 [Mycena leptocephala]|nr:hypothetical protein B0H13DRAFT_1861756 [Mycena leptocephala]